MPQPPIQPPMVGSWTVDVLAARPFEIHSDRYLELAVRTDKGDAVLRVPAHAWAAEPRPGQRVKITFLMGQVTKVEPA